MTDTGSDWRSKEYEEEQKMGFKNILVPTDGSEYTKAAIVKAMELAKLSGGKITEEKRKAMAWLVAESNWSIKNIGRP